MVCRDGCRRCCWTLRSGSSARAFFEKQKWGFPEVKITEVYGFVYAELQSHELEVHNCDTKNKKKKKKKKNGRQS